MRTLIIFTMPYILFSPVTKPKVSVRNKSYNPYVYKPLIICLEAYSGGNKVHL